jgi:uncharacterized protein YndB with AHSA1/START domain
MNETVTTEVELDIPPEEAWEHIIDPSWLGDEGRIIAEPGAEGEVIEDGELRVLVVEEVAEPDRFAFRWATFNEPPSRVEIEIIESDGGSRVIITETPLVPMATTQAAADETPEWRLGQLEEQWFQQRGLDQPMFGDPVETTVGDMPDGGAETDAVIESRRSRRWHLAITAGGR